MKTEAEVLKQVARVDRRIALLKEQMAKTEKEIGVLVARNNYRVQALRHLGYKRSELLTFELSLGV